MITDVKEGGNRSKERGDESSNIPSQTTHQESGGLGTWDVHFNESQHAGMQYRLANGRTRGLGASLTVMGKTMAKSKPGKPSPWPQTGHSTASGGADVFPGPLDLWALAPRDAFGRRRNFKPRFGLHQIQ